MFDCDLGNSFFGQLIVLEFESPRAPIYLWNVCDLYLFFKRNYYAHSVLFWKRGYIARVGINEVDCYDNAKAKSLRFTVKCIIHPRFVLCRGKRRRRLRQQQTIASPSTNKKKNRGAQRTILYATTTTRHDAHAVRTQYNEWICTNYRKPLLLSTNTSQR